MKKIFWVLLFPCFIQALVLQDEVYRDLELLALPLPHQRPAPQEILDVAIIGSGQSGMSLCFALYKQGVFNVQIFDSAPEGLEGPWSTIARMHTLRSSKECSGPALDIPHLTFHAWYEASGGDWESLGKIPTSLWADYLQWYRQILKLPIQNNLRLVSITPNGDFLKLLFEGGKEAITRKLVLATGFDGCGGFQIPMCIQQEIPKSCWFHTGEKIDPQLFKDKEICVIGAGPSAFDAAATALEAGATGVKMIMRKAEIPKISPFSKFTYWPAYIALSDEEKALFFQSIVEAGSAPPVESIARLTSWENFHFLPHTSVECLSFDAESRHVMIYSDKGPFKADLIVLGTGYAVDLSCVKELSAFADQILIWGDRLEDLSHKLGLFPYLGKHFEFLEKEPGSAPYLKNIHCFNSGAHFSQGYISVDINSIPIGTGRLAEGIATDLFLQRFELK